MTTVYDINYHTQNIYEAPVTEALFEFLVAPCNTRSQVVSNLSYTNSLGEPVFHTSNPFGFQVCRLRSTAPFKEFTFGISATVEKTEYDISKIKYVSIEDESAILNSANFYIENHLFLEFSKYTTISNAYQEKILNKKTDQPIFDFLLELNKYIYSNFEYIPDSTDVHTTADEVMELGKGVCQDYTHIFLAIARRNKIASRYVSGYLNQGDNLIGSAVMHAWVEAYIPGQGWRGFDPTNNLQADHHYIKAAHGADYSDCSPIKGILKTSGKNRTSYKVKVTPSSFQSQSQTQ